MSPGCITSVLPRPSDRCRMAVTLESYTHEDKQAQRDALGKIRDCPSNGSVALPVVTFG
jgi:hypothetical protein